MALKAYLGAPCEMIPWAPTTDPEGWIDCCDCRDLRPDNVFLLDDGDQKVSVETH